MSNCERVEQKKCDKENLKSTHSFRVLKMSGSPSPIGHIQFKTMAYLVRESGWNIIHSE